jgi:hypothetical protein
VVAHQRYIREELLRSDPRPVAASLRGYRVETISRDDAATLVSRYEWLGTVRGQIFVGLKSPEGELHGAVCFGHGPAGTIRNLIGGPALCLERGACVHWAPRNAASFLISRAVKLIHKLTGIARFFAYADPEAGENGGVYRAAGWAYLGQGLNGKGRQRRTRQYVLAPGADPADAGNWRTDRSLRRAGRRLSFRQARRRGYLIVTRAAKHVYATCVGSSRGRIAPVSAGFWSQNRNSFEFEDRRDSAVPAGEAADMQITWHRRQLDQLPFATL